MNRTGNTEKSALGFIKKVLPVCALFAVGTYLWLVPEKPESINLTITEQVSEKADDNHFGLPKTEGFELIKGQCSGCHSLKLVAQNKLTRQGWKDLIVWMQREQNLWDLGELEKPILDYLEAHCSPTQRGRRKPLSKIDWYVLDH